MTERTRWRPSVATLIAAAMVIAGFLLTGVSWWFMLLAAAGAVGPGVLREMGWLRDKDEFQRRADHRAGYHAFLVTGLVAFVLVAFFRSGERVVEHMDRLATLFLSLLWFTWIVSSLLSFWGARKMAARVLYAFGAIWLVFAIIANTGSEWTGWAALLLHPLLAAPFFALAWMSGRWPRIAGTLLIAVAIFFMQFLGFFRVPDLSVMSDGVVFIFLIGPLLATGLALVASAGDEVDDDDGDTSEKGASV